MKKHWLWKSLVALAICATQLVPVYITVMVSLKPQTDTSSYWSAPSSPFWANYGNAFASGHFVQAFANTAIITFGATLFVILLGTMTAYPLARNPSRFKPRREDRHPLDNDGTRAEPSRSALCHARPRARRQHVLGNHISPYHIQSAPRDFHVF